MKAPTTFVTIGENRFQIARFSPEFGSFILLRMLRAMQNAAQKLIESGAQMPKPQESDKKPTGEETARALAGQLFNDADFKECAFIQKRCMQSVSRMVGEAAMPTIKTDGEWVDPEIKTDAGLALRLTIESLVFNLSDFFDRGGMNELAG